ncbi:MAG TPA: GNAT family N-acetyltransferase [Candidatus Limnocylindria bacterium]
MATETSTLTVRAAVAADLPAMTVAKRDAGTAAWPHIFPPEVLSQLGFPERWTAAVIDPPQRTRALCAELDGEVVGFAIVRPSADDDASPETGELDGFYTAPAAWGRGAGVALLAAALEALREDGFITATLWTATDNHRPRRIYEKAGWRLDGTIRNRNLGGIAFEELRYRTKL